MKKIYMIVFLLVIIVVSSSRAQFNACSGTGTLSSSTSSHNCPNLVRIGNGTFNGRVQVTVTSVSGNCTSMGNSDGIRVYEGDGSLVAYLTDAGSSYTLALSALSDPANHGVFDLCLSEYCTPATTWQISWTTVDDCGVDMCSGAGGGCMNVGSITCTSGCDASGRIQCGTTATFCANNVTYSQRSSNWIHGFWMSYSGTGFVSSTMNGVSAPPNISSAGITYRWVYMSAPNFTSTNSGNNITQPAYYVETAGTVDPGNNLGYSAITCSNPGTFCFSIQAVPCSSGTGNLGCNINPSNTRTGNVFFRSTADSYSGSWTSTNCGLETDTRTFAYTVQCGAVLPVVFNGFFGKKVKNDVVLNWNVSTEQNAHYYVVYRSFDGQRFDSIATIYTENNGNNSNVSYYYTDKRVATLSYKSVYYRIGQVDYDRMYNSKTDIITVPLGNSYSGLEVIGAYPNPAKHELVIGYVNGRNENIHIEVYDMSGNVVLEKYVLAVDSDEPISNTSLDVFKLRSGAYIAKFITDSEVKAFSFLKE